MTAKPIDLLDVKQGKWTLKSETEFTTTAAPNTKFLLPKSRKPVEIAVQSFTTVAELEKKYGKRPIPADKFAYIRCNQNSFILLHVRNVNRLYFISTPYGIPVAVTHKEVFITEEESTIFFPQKAGAAPCTPDTTGYCRESDTNIAFSQNVHVYTSCNIRYVSQKDSDKYAAKYAELRAKYAEEPYMKDGKHLVDEDVWRKYQVPAGYVRMDYTAFYESDISKLLGNPGAIENMKEYRRLDYDGGAVCFIPEAWTKIGGFFSDPKVIARIPLARKIAAAAIAITHEQRDDIKKALCATV